MYYYTVVLDFVQKTELSSERMSRVKVNQSKHLCFYQKNQLVIVLQLF